MSHAFSIVYVVCVLLRCCMYALVFVCVVVAGVSDVSDLAYVSNPGGGGEAQP